MVTRLKQMWATDIPYIPVRADYVYLDAVIDWHGLYELSWKLSKTLEASSRMRAMAEAITVYGVPEIFNNNQGCQFTSAEFTE